MRRLTKGFTLAEALITLGIIGVIASLTLPSLTVNIQKQQAGPALAKAVNTLETANHLALEEKNARTLDQLGDYFDEAIADYVQWKVEPLRKTYYQYNGAAVYNFPGGQLHTTKDGITFIHSPGLVSLSNARLQTIGLGYGGKYYTVHIDVNGNSKGPNALGKDLFQVLVDTKGSVLPFGGAAWSAYTGNAVRWTNDRCGNRRKHPTQAVTCAGSIADNGYRVIY